MRQAGVVAAAGKRLIIKNIIFYIFIAFLIYLFIKGILSLTTMVDRLAEDHENAQLIAEGILF